MVELTFKTTTGRIVTLTTDEAREIYRELGVFFGPEWVPYTPPQPAWVWPTPCDRTGTAADPKPCDITCGPPTPADPLGQFSGAYSTEWVPGAAAQTVLAEERAALRQHLADTGQLPSSDQPTATWNAPRWMSGS